MPLTEEPKAIPPADGAIVLAVMQLMEMALADLARAFPDGDVARFVNNPALWDVRKLFITDPHLEDAVQQDVHAMLDAANQRLTRPPMA